MLVKNYIYVCFFGSSRIFMFFKEISIYFKISLNLFIKQIRQLPDWIKVIIDRYIVVQLFFNHSDRRTELIKFLFSIPKILLSLLKSNSLKVKTCIWLLLIKFNFFCFLWIFKSPGRLINHNHKNSWRTVFNYSLCLGAFVVLHYPENIWH